MGVALSVGEYLAVRSTPALGPLGVKERTLNADARAPFLAREPQ